MSVAPNTPTAVLVSISGVLQDPTAYSVSGTTLTFSSAPPSGSSNIVARYLGVPASGVTTTAYRTVTEYTATAGQTTFSPPSYTVGYIDVYRNGVRLGTADYTASNGTTVVLATGATVGDLIALESFYVSSVLNALPATGGTINAVAGATPLIVQKNGTTAVTLGGTSANLEVIGDSSTAILRTTTASGYAGLRVYNDQNSSLRALEIDYFGSTYSAGEMAWIGTTGAYPLSLATNNTIRFQIGATGTMNRTMTADGIAYQVKSSYAGNPSIIELGQSSSDGYIKVLDASGNATRITGYASGQSYFNCSVGFGGTTTTATYPVSISQGVPTTSGGNARLKIGNHIWQGTANDDMYLYGYNGNTTGGLLYVGNYYTFSARSIKSDITPLTNSLENICKLNGYSYTITDTGRKSVGLIADEVEQVYPDLVAHDEETGEANSVDYQSLVAVLIEAVKELKAEIEVLKGK
jgi:hypothetical protein